MFSQTGVYLFGGEAKISRTMNAFGAIHAGFFGLYRKVPFSVHARSGGDSGRIWNSGDQGPRGVYGKDVISVQATACTENQGFPYTWKMRVDSKRRNVGFLAQEAIWPGR